MTLPVVRLRERSPEDLAELTELLWEQQPQSRYPFRNPLPVPIAEFLHLHDALGAWVAEADGRLVGHVGLTEAPRAAPDALAVQRTCAREHGRPVEELVWVNALFTAAGARRLGVGRALLSHALDHADGWGRRACLEVLPVHPAALALYESTGWRAVDRFRPDWLTDDAPDVVVMVRDGV